MSRFFGYSDDDSDLSSDVETERPVLRGAATGFKQKGVMSESEEEEKQRVVKSVKDKRFDEMRSIIRPMRNQRKINDVDKLLSDFERLCEVFAKSRKVVDESGVPRFFTRSLSELDDYVTKRWEDKEFRTGLKKNQHTTLAKLRNKLRRFIRDDPIWEEQLAKYRENPDREGEETESELEVEEEETEGVTTMSIHDMEMKGIRQSSISLGDRFDDDESMSDWDEESSESSSSSSDVEGQPRGLSSYTLEYFLKKPEHERVQKTKKKKDRTRKTTKAPEPVPESDEDKDWEIQTAGAAMKLPTMFTREEDVTIGDVFRKMQEIMNNRVRRTLRFRKALLDLLDQLIDLVRRKFPGQSAAMEIRLLMSSVSLIFDICTGQPHSLPIDMWDMLKTYMKRLIDQLISSVDTVEVHESVAELDDEAATERESFLEAPIRIFGSPLTHFTNFDINFTQMLRSTDAHSPQYVSLLRDETILCDMLGQMVWWLERQKRTSANERCRAYLLQVEHLYYKLDRTKLVDEPGNDENATALFNTTVATSSATSSEPLSETCPENSSVAENTTGKPLENGPSTTTMTATTDIEMSSNKPALKSHSIEDLCKFIYMEDNQRPRTRATLCHIYYMAIHNRWYDARDLMLMSNLVLLIVHSDVPTQILYNRTMVQLGLCAFRRGLIREAHACLADLQGSSRIMELLAQGFHNNKYQEKTPEQEKQEKSRLLPYHMHINLELIECVYLISAMLIEVPFMAAHQDGTRRRAISRNFHYALRQAERQMITAPPETMREHVVAAAKHLKLGDCDTVLSFLINEKMDAKVWRLFPNPEKVKTMLAGKVREASLRCYLFTYSAHYQSVVIPHLAEMFQLPTATVKAAISKMIVSNELKASLDEPNETIVFQRDHVTKLQRSALQLVDKLSLFADCSERIMDTKWGKGVQPQSERGAGMMGNPAGSGRSGRLAGAGGDYWQGNRRLGYSGGSSAYQRQTGSGNADFRRFNRASANYW